MGLVSLRYLTEASARISNSLVSLVCCFCLASVTVFFSFFAKPPVSSVCGPSCVSFGELSFGIWGRFTIVVIRREQWEDGSLEYWEGWNSEIRRNVQIIGDADLRGRSENVWERNLLKFC